MEVDSRPFPNTSSTNIGTHLIPNQEPTQEESRDAEDVQHTPRRKSSGPKEVWSDAAANAPIPMPHTTSSQIPVRTTNNGNKGTMLFDKLTEYQRKDLANARPKRLASSRQQGNY
jgi:hypothetical protein